MNGGAERDIRLPGRAELEAAAHRLRDVAHHTPVLTSRTLDALAGARLFFKCENFQRIGAFKFRGACNAVFSLSPAELARGVATHSSGNHAQALALAAALKGTTAHIVMPSNAPRVKVAAVRGYGGRVHFCEPNQQAREALLAQVLTETGAVFVHPYDDPRVIAGQGTCAMELIAEVPDLDMLLVPVGGGGLLSGSALAAHHFAPGIRVVGCEPLEADDAYRSFKSGKRLPSLEPQTIADGLLTSLGSLTFPVVMAHVSDIWLADEPEIVAAMRSLWERMKIVVEPSGAVPLAALLQNCAALEGLRVGVVLSGGNVDLDRLPWGA